MAKKKKSKGSGDAAEEEGDVTEMPPVKLEFLIIVNGVMSIELSSLIFIFNGAVHFCCINSPIPSREEPIAYVSN